MVIKKNKEIWKLTAVFPRNIESCASEPVCISHHVIFYPAPIPSTDTKMRPLPAQQSGFFLGTEVWKEAAKTKASFF